MKTVIDLGDKFKNRCAIRYPAVHGSEVPENPETELIDHRKNEIKKYHVMFWHRLLKGIYGKPVEIECELLYAVHQEKPPAESIILKQTEDTDR